MLPSRMLYQTYSWIYLMMCALYRMSSRDFLSTWVPTQGDESAPKHSLDTVHQQDDIVLSTPVSSLKLDWSTSGMMLGRPVLKKRSFAM